MQEQDGCQQVSVGSPDEKSDAARRQSDNLPLQRLSARLEAIQEIDEPSELAKDELLKAAESLKNVVPNKFEAWRAYSTLWLAAISQLERRIIGPDEKLILLGVPLKENLLRDAAEKALRQCAHHASSSKQKIALIDEANKIRRVTWF